MSLLRSPVSLVIIAVNVLVFLLQTSTPAITTDYGLSQSNFENDPLTAITSGFLHADAIHLGMNMVAVLVLASGGWESLFGSFRYAIIYALSLLGGSAAVLLLSDPNTITVGASGAVYGLMGALLGGTIRARKHLSDTNSVLVPIAGYILLNLGFTFANPIISWQAHVGGLVVGLVTALVIGVRTPKNTRQEIGRAPQKERGVDESW